MPVVSIDCTSSSFDVCVIGAGPAGLAAAFELHNRGLKVIVVEAGPGTDAAEVDIVDPTRHATMAAATKSGLGGTSQKWGGRCVPLDPADFEARDYQDGPNWPFQYEELSPWWDAGAAFLGSQMKTSPPPGAFSKLRRHDASRSETWAAELDLSRLWRRRIEAADGPLFLTGARAIGFAHRERTIKGVKIRFGGVKRIVHARRVVVAAGGLSSLRLLLLLNQAAPGLVSGAARLGVGYMGHLTGSIAELAPVDSHSIDAFRRSPCAGGGFQRRRIQPIAGTVRAAKAMNIAFWLDNPPAEDPAHGSGASSAKYLLAGRMLTRGAPSLRPHLRNVAADPIGAATGVFAAAVGRVGLDRWRPTPLIRSRHGWRLHYHAEQAWRTENRVSLSDRCDADGLPRAKVEYGFDDADISSIVTAHNTLNEDLKAAGAGALYFVAPAEALASAVKAGARDGYHQIGGAVMSNSDADGVTSAYGEVFGLSGLYVASSAIFPRSSQANPTLPIVALALRTADHIAKTVT